MNSFFFSLQFSMDNQTSEKIYIPFLSFFFPFIFPPNFLSFAFFGNQTQPKENCRKNIMIFSLIFSFIFFFHHIFHVTQSKENNFSHDFFSFPQHFPGTKHSRNATFFRDLSQVVSMLLTKPNKDQNCKERVLSASKVKYTMITHMPNRCIIR